MRYRRFPNRLIGGLVFLTIAATPVAAQKDDAPSRETPPNVFAEGWQPAHALILRDVVSHFDRDGDGAITFREYQASMARQFDTWDLNGDRKLQAEEMPWGLETAMTDLMDANSDGRIGAREYATALTQIGRASDHNDDRRITASEIATIVRWGRLGASGSSVPEKILPADEEGTP